MPDELEVEVDESPALVVAVEAVEGEAEVPGMVEALTAAKTPTPATDAIEMLTVRFCRRRSAWSRALARARVVLVGSMPDRLPHPAKPCLRAGCEVAERRSEGGGYTLFEFNGAGRRWSRRVMPPQLSSAGRAQGALNQNSKLACPRSSVDRAGRS